MMLKVAITAFLLGVAAGATTPVLMVFACLAEGGESWLSCAVPSATGFVACVVCEACEGKEKQ